MMDWRQFLVVVRPETLVRWHRQGFRLFWHWKSRRLGRPRIPVSLQNLIADMARANQTWGEERIAPELLLKLDDDPLPILPRSFHLPRASSEGSRTTNLNKTGVRLWT
jgi:hypothetical protein